MRSFWLHRTLCDTLEEMRNVIKVSHLGSRKRSFKTLQVLIEEAQSYGNRMESALEYQKDITKLYAERKELLNDIKLLKEAAGKKDEEDAV